MLLLEHPPTITLGRRTEEGEVHVPAGADVDVVEVDRGGKSTYHAPGQLVCYPIFDLTRHGQDVQAVLPRPRGGDRPNARSVRARRRRRIEGLTGVWLESPPRKIASIGIHLTKWVSTHGYALNVDLDPAPFTDWITACGLDGYAFTSMARELGRPLRVDDVRPAAAQALADVFELAFEDAPARGRRRPHRLTVSVRPAADHLPMEATLRLLAWVGIVAAASVGAALAIGVLFGSI